MSRQKNSDKKEQVPCNRSPFWIVAMTKEAPSNLRSSDGFHYLHERSNSTFAFQSPPLSEKELFWKTRIALDKLIWDGLLLSGRYWEKKKEHAGPENVTKQHFCKII